MGLFIELKVDQTICRGVGRCGKCIEVCPVNVFEEGGKMPGINAENEDECILCDLCISACEPLALEILKLY